MGCNSSTKPCPERKQVVVPNSLLQACQPLQSLKTGEMVELASVLVDSSGKYHQVCAQNKTLIKTINILQKGTNNELKR
jgi:hypothetical protein